MGASYYKLDIENRDSVGKKATKEMIPPTIIAVMISLLRPPDRFFVTNTLTSLLMSFTTSSTLSSVVPNSA